MVVMVVAAATPAPRCRWPPRRRRPDRSAVDFNYGDLFLRIADNISSWRLQLIWNILVKLDHFPSGRILRKKNQKKNQPKSVQRAGTPISLRLEHPRKLTAWFTWKYPQRDPRRFTSNQTIHFGALQPLVDSGGVPVFLQLSHEKKQTSYFPLYWMVNRDPYNGLL